MAGSAIDHKVLLSDIRVSRGGLNLSWQVNQDSSIGKVCQARDLEVRGLNPSSGSNFSLDI